MALWDKYGMLDNIRAHSRLVAHIATELARRPARPASRSMWPLCASAMLHDIAKTYSVLHGGSHAQLGASWVVAETRNHALAQGVLLHVHWPWAVPEREPGRLFSIRFFVIHADKRVKHDQCVPLRQRYEGPAGALRPHGKGPQGHPPFMAAGRMYRTRLRGASGVCHP